MAKDWQITGKLPASYQQVRFTNGDKVETKWRQIGDIFGQNFGQNLSITDGLKNKTVLEKP